MTSNFRLWLRDLTQSSYFCSHFNPGWHTLQQWNFLIEKKNVIIVYIAPQIEKNSKREWTLLKARIPWRNLKYRSRKIRCKINWCLEIKKKILEKNNTKRDWMLMTVHTSKQMLLNVLLRLYKVVFINYNWMDRNNHGYYEWIEITMVLTFTPYLVLYLKWMCVPFT